VIALQRTRTPAAIAPAYRSPARNAHLLHLLDVRLKRAKLNEKLWGQVKELLKTESAGKCGYCESPTSLVAYGDVEHIRPKSEYWWLAYCYDNYIYSCQLCNQKYKKTKFPVSGPKMTGPVLPEPPDPPALAALAETLCPDPLDQAGVDALVAECLAEQPGIPDPYVVDPETLFSWLADDNLREVEVRARDASRESRRAFTAVDGALGLNRQELKSARYYFYSLLELPLETLRTRRSAAQRRTAEGALRAMMAPTAPFAGMVRYFVREVEGLDL
jgi:5-methylcytosine-specific restriction endonuclease McrA